MSEKIITALISAIVSIITVILTSLLNHFLKKDRKNKKVNKNINKGEKNANSLQIATGDGGKFTVNVYHYLPSKGSITSPEIEINKNEKKNQAREIEREGETTWKNSVKSKDRSEKDQDMSQQEFERLLMKVKFIAFGIMGNIKWDKVKPLEFWKEKGEEFARLEFEVERKSCVITYEITKKDKQKFLETNVIELVERFITLRLVSYGRNDYFDDNCPKCKQVTLTKSSIVNDPGKEAISCILCRWAISMEVYLEYLNDKKCNLSLEFYEWLGERNRRMVRNRKN